MENLEEILSWGKGEEKDTQRAEDLQKETNLIAQSILKKSSKQVFKDCDKDKDGALDATEVREALAILGCQMDNDAFDKMFQDCDKDLSGSINYKEFLLKILVDW